MALLPIKLIGHPALRTKAKKVTKIDRHVQRLLDDMLETMREATGVGLAANQVGVAQRLLVAEVGDTFFQLVNPEIVHGEGEQIGDEGCLSIPGYYGEVKRAQAVLLEGRDKLGKLIRLPAEGLLARVFQHEIDHLNGVLFLDRLTSLGSLGVVEVEQEPQELRL